MSGFDHRTHIRDPKTGEVIEKNYYTRVVDGTGEHYIRGGEKFHANGAPFNAPVAQKVATPVEPPKEVVAPKSKAQSALEKGA